MAPINVDDDDDDDMDDYNHNNNNNNNIGDSDSDSTSIPEKVKRITHLQKRVAELEAILKEYRNKENDNRRNSDDNDYRVLNVQTPSVSDYPLNTPNILNETPSVTQNNHSHFQTDYKKIVNQSKGNIV